MIYKVKGIGHVQQQITFEKFLTASFEKRTKKNPSYSLRAFARDIGVTSSNLSKAMNGSRGFSKETLQIISQRLALNHEEAHLFKSLCESKFAKSKKARSEAAEKLKQALLYNIKIADDKVALISDWHHMAILALMCASDFKSDIGWISDRLLIHEKVTQQAIERLISLGMVQNVQGQFKTTGNLFIDPKGIPSSAVKEFHHQIIEKADHAIDMQGLDDRDIASIVFSFNKSRMAEAKAKIKKFREEFAIEFGPREGDSNQEVYALAVQFFQISKSKEQKIYISERKT